MLEMLQYVTSGFWVFVGSVLFISSSTLCMGWALNAAIIGFKGVKCDNARVL